MSLHLRSSESQKPTLAVDFDGVIHSYDAGWQDGAIYGDLVPGTKDALIKLSKHYRLVCFTARHNLEDVNRWMVRHGIAHLFKDTTNRKPAAHIYLDDRAVRFTTWDEALKEIHASQER